MEEASLDYGLKLRGQAEAPLNYGLKNGGADEAPLNYGLTIKKSVPTPQKPEKKPWYNFLYEDPEFLKKNPTVYGLYGTAKGIAEAIGKIGFVKYGDPVELKNMLAMDPVQQRRQLLMDTLESETLILFDALPMMQALKARPGAIGSPARKLVDAPAGSDADKALKMYERADAEIQAANKLSVRKAFEWLKRVTWDTSGNAKAKLLKQGGQVGKQAVIRHDLCLGASNRAARVIDDASKQIYGGLNKSEGKLLDYMIQSKRTLEIHRYNPKVKHPGFRVKEHEDLLNKIPATVKSKLEERANKYFDVMQKQLDDLLANDLISVKEYNNLAKHIYEPRRFLKDADPTQIFNFGSDRLSIHSSGLKKLGPGDITALENDSKLLMSEYVARVQGRIMKNRANQSLYQFAKEAPDNGLVRLIQPKQKERLRSNENLIAVMMDGKKRLMAVADDFAKEWVTRDTQASQQLLNTIQWLTGTKMLKAMATGLNPEFALTNFPRDLVHSWLTTNEYSSFAPRWLAQLGKDLAVTAKDAFLRKGQWIKYIDDGGGMEMLTHQGRGKLMKGPIGAIQKVMSYLGESSEIWTRLALRTRSMKNAVAKGMSIDDASEYATWVARTYLDFNQGGSYIKAADAALPYLNASIQATRGLVRGAANNPVKFTMKSAQLGTLATGLYMANRTTNPECLEQVPDVEKANNFIITTPIKYKDKEGETRYIYYKVAKDQSQRLLCTIFEAMAAKANGDEIDVNQVVSAAKDLVPLLPTQAMPPILDAIIGYACNKDFWMQEDIWRGPEVKAGAETTAGTHPGWQFVGQKLDISPVRTRYALSQFFTRGNIYTDMVGLPLKQILDNVPEDTRISVTEKILELPFVRRVANQTHPQAPYWEKAEEFTREENTVRYKQNQELGKLLDQIDQGNADMAAVRQFIKDQPVLDRNRLLNRVTWNKALSDTKFKRWWMGLSDPDMPPAAKARMYYFRWTHADESERKQLEKDLFKVPRLAGTQFMATLKKLRQRDKVGE